LKNEYVKMENFFVFAKLGLVWYDFLSVKTTKEGCTWVIAYLQIGYIEVTTH